MLTDLDAARAFYTAVFGYGYEKVDGAPGDYVMFQLGEAPLGGMGGMMGSPPGTPSHWVAYFSVADVDAAVAAATGAGGTLLGDPMNNEFGRIAFLTDPDDAVFALAGPGTGRVTLLPDRAPSGARRPAHEHLRRSGRPQDNRWVKRQSQGLRRAAAELP